MPKLKSTIQLNVMTSPWILDIDENKAKQGPRRELSNVQIVFCFMVLALLAPPEANSQRKRLAWLRQYVSERGPVSDLQRRLDNLSSQSLERYMVLCEDADIYEFGVTKKFGEYLLEHKDTGVVALNDFWWIGVDLDGIRPDNPPSSQPIKVLDNTGDHITIKPGETRTIQGFNVTNTGDTPLKVKDNSTSIDLTEPEILKLANKPVQRLSLWARIKRMFGGRY